MASLASPTDREQALLNSLNHQPLLDYQLLEAVKLLMLLSGLELYDQSRQGRPIPTFVCLLFGRDTARSLEDWVGNHLNVLGDTAGFEQVIRLNACYDDDGDGEIMY